MVAGVSLVSFLALFSGLVALCAAVVNAVAAFLRLPSKKTFKSANICRTREFDAV